MGGILGGGSKGGGGGTTQTTSTVNTGPWSIQAPVLADVFTKAHELYDKNPAFSYYPDSTVSPFTSAQNQGYQSVIDMGLSGSPFLPASMQNATDTLSGKFLDPSTNPWLEKTFNGAADAVGRQFKTITAPTTDAMFSGNGAFNSSGRYNAQNNNNMGLGATLNNLATQIYGGNYNNERGRQITTQGMVPSLTQARYLDPTAAINAGGAQQGQSQKELSDLVNRYMYGQQSPWQTLGLYKQMVDGSYGQQGTTTSQQPYYSNPAGQALGGIMGLGGLAGQLGWQPFGAAAGAGLGSALSGAGIGSAFASGAALDSGIPLAALALSDARAKEDIAPVGKTFDGQNLYAYRYKGDPTPHVGLMAQEVEQRDPGAVVEHPSGLKMVDYSRALRFSSPWGA